MTSTANKTIAKNTAMLYFRMLFLTIINIYCVRVTLETLGVEDYGIYNVIGSAVWSLSILKITMSSATQRFFAFHLGKKDYDAYSKTFTTLLIGFIIIAIITLIVGEILGFYFLNSWLKIPADRLYAAKYVYQLSLLTVVLDLIMVPYVSSIIANERMSAFAIFSIADGLLKLAVVFLLVICNYDKLILYGYLMLAVNVVIFLMHYVYCRIEFKYCKYIFEWNKAHFKELISYTGWNMIGSISATLTIQGQNILLNIFFGPMINAAKAIGDKIMNVVNSFSSNLYMAVSPQIIKSYASGDLERSRNLVIRSSKISFMLLYIISFPIICKMDFILQLWLGNDSKTPDMVVFSQLMLIYCLAFSLEQPITRIIQATGNIKKYQIYIGIFTLSFIPVAALLLWFGAPAPSTMITQIAIVIISQYIRVYIAHNQTGLSYQRYLKEVIIPIVVISSLSIPIYILLDNELVTDSAFLNIIGFVSTFILSVILSLTIGMTKQDRSLIYKLIHRSET